MLHGKRGMIKAFGDIYKGKKVLVTGHTGFKGSWLCVCLLELGAKVTGYSLKVPSNPANFDIIGLQDKLKHVQNDVRNLESLKKVFDDVLPDVVFHLSAQALTRPSYDIPQETFFTNLGGTVNILECIRKSNSVKAAVIVTSDKCYQNVEWLWGYRENDRLGGDDPYSASKACAEIACHAYIKSFFSKDNAPRISTARAGNVMGGGDWAADRIVPDCVRAFSKNEQLVIRSPKATRPWQHVLEPINGYLLLGANLLKNNRMVAGESFNFGPSNKVNKTVEELIKEFIKVWSSGKWSALNDKAKVDKKESTLLMLNCDKAFQYLNWHTILSFPETIKMTAEWYKSFYGGEKDMYGLTVKQINEYLYMAKSHGLSLLD